MRVGNKVVLVLTDSGSVNVTKPNETTLRTTKSAMLETWKQDKTEMGAKADRT